MVDNTYEILLVEDDGPLRELLSTALLAQGYRVTAVLDGETALRTMVSQPFDLVVSDLVMTGVNGIKVLQQAKKLHPDRPVVIITGNADKHLRDQALHHSVDDYILKPFGLKEFFQRLRACLEPLNQKQQLL